MTWYLNDYNYLLAAYTGRCVVSVRNPEARKSLQRLGYMEHVKPQKDAWRWTISHPMTLTKLGQKRAKEILDQQSAERIRIKRDSDRRGIRGAAVPKRYKLIKPAIAGGSK